MIRFKRFRYSLGILIISAVLCSFWQRANAQVVEIPDPNLERAVREELELSAEVLVTQEEMLRLKRLELLLKQIKDITGLQHAKNLTFLNLADNRISDITPLGELVNLEGLAIRDNPIGDITPLGNLANLEYLNAGGINLTDITPLSNLTELRTLWIWHNRITDITPLTNLTQLEKLGISYNQITDISPLANLTALKELRIDNNQIVDVSPLANLTRLTDLTIANNVIIDFRPLFGLNLQRVDVDIHRLQELASSGLQELASSEIEIPDPNLNKAIREALVLPDENPITQLEMLKLRRLELLLKQIQDITGLQHAKNLTFLNLADNRISDITPLGELVNLEGLAIRDNPIGDITPLGNLVNLEYLNAGGINLTDITPLSSLTELRTLQIWHNRISDITPLANLTQLEELGISYNQIIDISPLANLTALKELWIDNNQVLDFSPIQGLSLADFRYDQVCLLSDPPIRDRIKHRSLPSIVQAFRTGVGLSPLSPEDFISLHDIYWTANLFGLHFLQTPLGYTPAGVIEAAIDSREEYLAKNPNMIFLVNIKINSASYSHFPEDWFGWVRDENGNPVRSDPDFEAENLIDMRLPEVQDIIVQQAVSVSTCGLYDGIMFDWWPPAPFVLTSYNADGSVRAREKVEENITLPIVQRIRRAVPDDFLILCNRNREKLPLSAPYINGAFMETHPRDREKAYTRADIIEIETNLIWLEQNLREPQINCLKGHGIPTEPPDSPANQQQMRLFTTMSLTLSDGYVVYSTGRWFSDHIWYPFWAADVGQPVGPTAQHYQEDIEGLYIREFTNGWAVYNRSGQAQSVTLPLSATSVSDRGSSAASITHLLPDLDGEIYLKAKHPADVNGDWVVNILDLVQVANSFGKSEPVPSMMMESSMSSIWSLSHNT